MQDPSRIAQLAMALALGLFAAGGGRATAQPPADHPHGERHAPAGGHGHAQAERHHDAHELDHLALEVPDGHVRWTPDAPLIEGMRRVRAAMADLRAGPPPSRATAAASQVDAAIAYMFDNCELAPEPDVALHAILARLMAGTRSLRADPADAATIDGMQAAMDHYHALFDDPAH